MATSIERNQWSLRPFALTRGNEQEVLEFMPDQTFSIEANGELARQAGLFLRFPSKPLKV